MDVSKYIGIPFRRGSRDVSKGLDCWGLAVYFYHNEYGITLPTYQEIDTSVESIEDSSSKLVETESYRNFEEVVSSKQGDLAIFNIGGHPIHIGVVLDSNHMLHTFDNTGSSVERFTNLKWKNRLHSFHRHETMI